MKAGYCNAFTPLVDMTNFGLRVSPMVTCTGIQKDRDKEKVYEAASELGTITSFALPLLYYVGDSRYITDFEMLPASVRRDRVKVIRAKVTLVEDLLACT